MRTTSPSGLDAVTISEARSIDPDSIPPAPTPEEIAGMTVAGLRKLAAFYEKPIPTSWKKAQIVEHLTAALTEPDVEEPADATQSTTLPTPPIPATEDDLRAVVEGTLDGQRRWRTALNALKVKDGVVTIGHGAKIAKLVRKYEGDVSLLGDEVATKNSRRYVFNTDDATKLLAVADALEAMLTTACKDRNLADAKRLAMLTGRWRYAAILLS